MRREKKKQTRERKPKQRNSNAQTGARQQKSQEKTRTANGENEWEETMGCELGRGLRGFEVLACNLIRFIGAYRNVVGGFCFQNKNC